MADATELIKQFGMILPAVEEMMGEQKLSCEQAMEAVWKFMVGILEDAEPPQEVIDAIDRLSVFDNELELRFALNRECLRALGKPYQPVV